MLDNCILVSIDEEKLKKEEDRIKLKWIKRKGKKQAKKLQIDLEFTEACFEGDQKKVEEYMKKYPVSANT